MRKSGIDRESIRESMQNYIDDLITGWEDEVEERNTRISDLEDDVERLEERREELESDNKSMVRQIEELEAEVEMLRTKGVKE